MSSKRIERRLNAPLLIGSALALVVLGPSASAWHSYQLKHTAGTFWSRAEQLESEAAECEKVAAECDEEAATFEKEAQHLETEKDAAAASKKRAAASEKRDAAREKRAAASENWAAASGYLHRFASVRRGETENPQWRDAQYRLARTFDKGVKDVRGIYRAIELHRAALGIAKSAAEDRDDVRAQILTEFPPRLAEQLIEVRQFGQAVTVLEAAQKDSVAQPSADGGASQTDSLTKDEKLASATAEVRRAQKLLAIALYAQFQGGKLKAPDRPLSDVGDAIELAVLLNPGDIPLSTLFAHVLRNEPQLLAGAEPAVDRRLRADEVMDKLVAHLREHDPHNPQAYLVRIEDRIRARLPDAAAELSAALASAPDPIFNDCRNDLEQAMLVAPRDSAVLLTAAQFALAQSAREPAIKSEHLAEARGYFEQVVTSDPTNGLAQLWLGNLLLAEGDREKAIALWREDLSKLKTGGLDVRFKLIEVLLDDGQFDDAGKELDALDTAFESSRSNYTRDQQGLVEIKRDMLRAKWFLAKGSWHDGVALLQRVVARSGKKSDAEQLQTYDALILLGRIAKGRSENDVAMRHFEEAADLLPDAALANFEAGETALAGGWHETAAMHFERALAVSESFEALEGLVRARMREQTSRPVADRRWAEFNKAIARLRQAAGREPNASDPQLEAESLPSACRIDLLELQYEATRLHDEGKSDEAKALVVSRLRDIEKRYPESAALLRMLVEQHLRVGNVGDADRLVARYAAVVGNEVEHLLLQADLALAQHGVSAARQVLENAPPSARGDRRLRLALINCHLREAQLESARDELVRLHGEHRSDWRVVAGLIDISLDLKDLASAEHWERILYDLQGSESSLANRFRAQRLILDAQGPGDPKLVEAERLQAKVLADRPRWPSAHLLHAMILERKGQTEAAIDAYQRAIQLGERRVAVYEKLVSLLYRQKRLVDAARYLAEIQEKGSDSKTLAALDISIAAQTGDLERALSTAQREVQERSTDPTAHLWLGQMLAANKRFVEAEQSFLEAVRLAPKEMQTQNGLFSFYIQSKQLNRARQALESMVRQLELSDADRHFALAQGYELIGDRPQAEEHYREAMRLMPTKVALLERFAAFSLRSNQQEAEQTLRRILEIDPKHGGARRTLAILLAPRGIEDEEAWEEARRLLQSGDESDSDPADQRTLALLLALHNERGNVAEARQILEDLVRDPKNATDRDRLLLAKLLEAEAKACRAQGHVANAKQKTQAAHEQYLFVVTRATSNPSYVALFVDFLLECGENEREQATSCANEAAPWLAKLELARPDSLSVALLRGRWLKLSGRENEIAGIVEPIVERQLEGLSVGEQDAASKRAQLLSRTGAFFDRVRLFDRAEVWFRRLYEMEPRAFDGLALSLVRQQKLDEAVELWGRLSAQQGSPRVAAVMLSLLLAANPNTDQIAALDPLVTKALVSYREDPALLASATRFRFLQGRVDEALELWQRLSGQQDSPRLAATMLGLLLAANPSPKHLTAAEPLVAKALSASANDPALLTAVANLRCVQARTQEAIALYERVLRSKPDDLLSLNNAATLLAEEKQSLDRAMEYIERAISLAGEKPALLDTKGMILVHAGRANEAVPILERAVGETTADPRFRFHLAVAYDRVGRSSDARTALRTAIEQRLTSQILTESDEQLLAEMRARYSN
ncbi:MAG: tetratricopeptide repeat protein [Planctomycetota bacterium]